MKNCKYYNVIADMKNLTKEPRSVDMKFTATAFYYTGVTGEEVAHGQYTCDLKPDEGERTTLDA